MIDFQKVEDWGKEYGFSHVVPLDCATIELLPQVRSMCEANSCHMYGKNWSCPPACGTLDECQEKVEKYKHGIIVQTVGILEDSMDGEGMMEAEARHKKSFYEFEKKLRKQWPALLPIGAGCCIKCPKCTYPEAPCRYPGQSISSMEAYGMLVSEVCKANDLKYYYGPCTIAYTSCYLLE